MGSASAWQVESLERWSPTLFLVAGVLLVGYATLNGVAAFTDVAYPTVEDVVGPAGFALGFLGLLGLYPTFAEESPRLARAGAVGAALGAVGFSAITLGGLVVLAGGESPSWTAVSVLLATIGMIAGYLSFAVASARVELQPRTVGYLLSVPAVVFAVMLSQAILFARFGLFSGTTMAWSAFAISSGQAVAHVSIGYSLRRRITPNEREVPSADVTAG